MKTAEEYRARVIQLESFVARLALVHRLTDKEDRIYRYVRDTSIAMTEDRDTEPHTWQKVKPLEDVVASRNEALEEP